MGESFLGPHPILQRLHGETKLHRMSLSWWLSIGAGGLVMGMHAGLRVLTHRLALRFSDRRLFLLVELGGLGARMMIAFIGVALGLAYAPLHEGAFIGTVLILLVLSMALEARAMIRRMETGRLCP